MVTNVLIADDHGLVRAGLRALLTAEPDLRVVGEAADGRQAVTMAQRLHPDVLLADISMPGASGIEVAKELRHTSPAIRVLIVTMHEDTELLREAMAAGASGYIIKRALESELITAVRLVAQGGSYVHPSLRDSVSLQPSPSVRDQRPMQMLSEPDCTLLTLLARGHTNAQVAEALGVTEEEANLRRSEIMARLHLRGRIDVIRFIQAQQPVSN